MFFLYFVFWVVLRKSSPLKAGPPEAGGAFDDKTGLAKAHHTAWLVPYRLCRFKMWCQTAYAQLMTDRWTWLLSQHQTLHRISQFQVSTPKRDTMTEVATDQWLWPSASPNDSLRSCNEDRRWSAGLIAEVWTVPKDWYIKFEHLSHWSIPKHHGVVWFQQIMALGGWQTTRLSLHSWIREAKTKELLGTQTKNQEQKHCTSIKCSSDPWFPKRRRLCFYFCNQIHLKLLCLPLWEDSGHLWSPWCPIVSLQIDIETIRDSAIKEMFRPWSKWFAEHMYNYEGGEKSRKLLKATQLFARQSLTEWSRSRAQEVWSDSRQSCVKTFGGGKQFKQLLRFSVSPHFWTSSLENLGLC